MLPMMPLAESAVFKKNITKSGCLHLEMERDIQALSTVTS